MSRTQTKIRVETKGLLEAVRTRRTKMVEEHKKATSAYQSSKSEYQGKVVAALREAAGRAEKGKLPETNYRSLEIPFRKERLEKPELRLEAIDRLIKTLNLASDATILISADDAAEYLG